MKITQEMVYAEILKEMNKKDLFCTRLDGSKYIPKTVQELPAKIKLKKSVMYRSAYQRVRYDGTRRKYPKSTVLTNHNVTALVDKIDIGAERNINIGHWSKKDTDKAIEMFNNGKSMKLICVELNRTYNSTKEKLRGFKIGNAVANHRKRITVTKDTRVQETTDKKLVVNWPTMTCTIEGSLITVDFKI